MKNWKLGMGCFVVLLILLVGGGVAFWFLAPDVEEQFPPGIRSAIITVTTPLNGATLPMNSFTSVQAEVIGMTPITMLELWVDGAPAQSKINSDKSNQFSTFWTWTPTKEGEHVLFVRATDAQQRVTTSNVVRVTSSKAANDVIKVDYQPKPGDTLPSVAQNFNTTPQQIVDLNPELDQNKPLTPGQNIDVPAEIPSSPPAGGDSTGEPPSNGGDATTPPADEGEPAPSGNEPTEDAPKNPPSKFCVWLPWVCNPGGSFNFNVAPKAPKLGVQVKGCDVKLVISDRSNNEIGFFIYRADAISHDFKRIATLDAHGGTTLFGYVDQQMFGHVTYYISSFNKWGESPSKYVKVEIENPVCATPDWTAIGIQNGKLKVKEPVEKVYCYLSVNNGPWTRIPPNQNAFLEPKNGEFDMSDYLKKLAPTKAGDTVKLALQCWGWKGNTLVYLGETETTIKKGLVQIDLGKVGQLVGILGNIQRNKPLPPTPTEKIDPPSSFHTAKDVEECEKHFIEGLMTPGVCQALLDSGKYQVLVWKWSPKVHPGNSNDDEKWITEIDGYKIYELPVMGTPTLVASIGNPKATMHSVYRPHLPDTVFAMSQFVVVAYKGDLESEHSNTVYQEKYVAPAPSPKDVKLNPIAIKSSRKSKTGTSVFSFSTTGTGWPPIGQGQILAGFYGYDDSGLFSQDYNSQYYRGAMWFDVSNIKDEILEAKLYLPVRGGEYQPTPSTATNQVASCAAALMLATEDWRGDGYNKLIPGIDYLPLGVMLASDLPAETVLVDMTDIVKKWQKGTLTNYGLVLRGNNESLVQMNIECTTFYGDMFLKLKTLAK